MVAGENDSSCSYKCPSMSGCRYRIAQIKPVFMQYVAHIRTREQLMFIQLKEKVRMQFFIRMKIGG